MLLTSAGFLQQLRAKTYLLAFVALFSTSTLAKPPCTAAMQSLLTGISRDTVTPKRSLEEIPELKMGTYNTLYLMKGLDSTPRVIKHRQDVAQAILENDLDVITLQEVSDFDKLQKFSDTYLQGRYIPFLSAGNDERGIQIAFLVKKDLPFQMKLESHADTRGIHPVTGQEIEIFSRDTPTLSIWSDTQDVASDDPLVIFNGTHLKSKRDSNGDPESRLMRAAQVKATVGILDAKRAKHPSSMVMIAGDFNGDVAKEAEFAALRESMVDVFETQNLSEADRITHSFHPNGGKTSYSQLDAFFVSPDKASYVSKAFVHRYKDASGNVKRLPRSFGERMNNPSDHFPVILKMNFRKMLEDRRLLKQQAQDLPEAA